jgi:hypothetical protein
MSIHAGTLHSYSARDCPRHLAAGSSARGSKLFNLKADRFIANHDDVRNEQVAHAMLSATATV